MARGKMPDEVPYNWARIEAWLQANAPEEDYVGSAAGASDEAIRSAESAMGCRLPDDVRAWFALRNEYFAGLPDWDLDDLERVVSTWKMLHGIYASGYFAEFRSDPTGPIRTEWWHPGWVPITNNLGGDHLCIDLAPTEGGTLGQVIWWIHDDDHREVVAPSFNAWLRQMADGLEAGRYEFDDDGLLVRRA
jgi:cell wall assembly regulator SMI1